MSNSPHLLSQGDKKQFCECKDTAKEKQSQNIYSISY